MAMAIARDYLALAPDERKKTLLLAGTNQERLMITRLVREGLKTEGNLGQGLTVKRLKARDLTETQAGYAHHFQPGNMLIPQASYRRLGLEKGQRYEVLAADSRSNGLMLRGKSGAALQVDPAQIKRKSVYEVEEMEIAVGDRLKWTKNHRSPTGVGVGEAYLFAKRLPQQKDNRLRWTRNDHALERRNDQEFEVVGLEKGQVMIRWGRGEVGCFESSELAHLDYALVSTTYAAQGKSAERVIGALDRHVARQSFYVAVSRVKHDLKLYVSEDLDALVERARKSRAKENPSEAGCSPFGPNQSPLQNLNSDRGFGGLAAQNSFTPTRSPSRDAERNQKNLER